MIHRIINPFKYIAGTKSLLIGLGILLLTSIIGFFSNTHFPDTISVKINYESSIFYFILQNLSNWIIISFLLYIMAIIFSKTSIRMIDVFGTQALARFPYLIASFLGFSVSVNKFAKYILWTTFQIGEHIELTIMNILSAIILIILAFILTIWLIVLIFNAFTVSTNIKGRQSVWIFIIALISSMVITHYISIYLMIKFS